MDKLASLDPVVIDIIIGVIILLFALIKGKIGILKGILSIAAFFVAIAIALVASKMLTPVVKPYVWEKAQAKIEQTFDNELENIKNGSSGLGQTVKESWNTFLDSFGASDILKALKSDDAAEKALENTDLVSTELVQQLRELAIKKGEIVFDKALRAALFVVIYIVVHLILKLVVKWANKVGDLPVLGWVNHGLGFIVGIIEIVVILLIVVRGANLFNSTFFTDLSEGTFILRWLCGEEVFELAALQGEMNNLIKNIIK